MSSRTETWYKQWEMNAAGNSTACEQQPQSLLMALQTATVNKATMKISENIALKPIFFILGGRFI